jgi:D-glycero-alpha-D-manno-heptose-7-phosphate kinase
MGISIKKVFYPNIVTTVTPQRISFTGGGTDFEEYYCDNSGAVVSSTIDKYVYVTVKRHSPLFEEMYRLSYSKTEHVNSLDEIENDIIRECLRFLPVEPPLFISTAADLPASSGLGSSSSFAVGLLLALHQMRGERVSPGQLAEEACHVEIAMLRRPIGKQDQYAAAIGGLSHIQFERSGQVNINPIWLKDKGVEKLFRHLVLVWTGMQRDASDILADQKEKIDENQMLLKLIASGTKRLLDLLSEKTIDFKEFGRILHEGWQTKKSLGNSVSNGRIDELYGRLLSGGGYGGKISGAGGGGFLLLVTPPDKLVSIQNDVGVVNVIQVAYEPHGSRVLSCN